MSHLLAESIIRICVVDVWDANPMETFIQIVLWLRFWYSNYLSHSQLLSFRWKLSGVEPGLCQNVTGSSDELGTFFHGKFHLLLFQFALSCG